MLNGLRKKIQFFQYIINPVYAKRNTYAGNIWNAKQTGEIIVTATTANASHVGTDGFYFEDGAGVIVKSTGKGEINE